MKKLTYMTSFFLIWPSKHVEKIKKSLSQSSSLTLGVITQKPLEIFEKVKESGFDFFRGSIILWGFKNEPAKKQFKIRIEFFRMAHQDNMHFHTRSVIRTLAMIFLIISTNRKTALFKERIKYNYQMVVLKLYGKCKL